MIFVLHFKGQVIKGLRNEKLSSEIVKLLFYDEIKAHHFIVSQKDLLVHYSVFIGFENGQKSFFNLFLVSHCSFGKVPKALSSQITHVIDVVLVMKHILSSESAEFHVSFGLN
jgi:hypothetical protein